MTEFEEYYGSLPQAGGNIYGESQRELDEWLRQDVAQNERTKQTMIELQRNNIPQGEAIAKRGVQFLKPLHITKKDGHLAKIYKVTTDKPDNFGNPYVVYFTFDGQRYSKGFKSTSDNLASLVDLLGPDETKWIGKAVVVGKHTDDDGNERLIFAGAKVSK